VVFLDRFTPVSDITIGGYLRPGKNIIAPHENTAHKISRQRGRESRFYFFKVFLKRRFYGDRVITIA